MSSELLSVEQKRKAIERGLSPYMNSSVLKSTLNYWEDAYGKEPSFVLNKFLTEICTTDELRFFKKDILKKVLSELATVEKEVLQSPSKSTVVPDVILAKKTYDAFLYFVKEITSTISAVTFYEFNNDVQNSLMEMDVEILTNETLNSKIFLDFIPPEQYSKVLTAIYEVYCNYYGPPRADKLYSGLKNKLKQDYPEIDLHKLL
jgi:hypothetical protein